MRRSPLWAQVETQDGARFSFGAADRTELRLARYVREQEAKGCDIDLQDLSPELGRLLCDYFVEAVRDWEGFEARGEPVAFGLAEIREVDANLKIEAALLGLAEREAMWGKGSRPAEQPTCSMPPAEQPGEAAEAGPRATTQSSSERQGALFPELSA